MLLFRNTHKLNFKHLKNLKSNSINSITSRFDDIRYGGWKDEIERERRESGMKIDILVFLIKDKTKTTVLIRVKISINSFQNVKTSILHFTPVYTPFHRETIYLKHTRKCAS